MLSDDEMRGLSDGESEAGAKSELGSDFFDHQGSVMSGAKGTDSAMKKIPRANTR